MAGSNSEGEQVSPCRPPLGMVGLAMGLVGASSEVGLDRATIGGTLESQKCLCYSAQSGLF